MSFLLRAILERDARDMYAWLTRLPREYWMRSGAMSADDLLIWPDVLSQWHTCLSNKTDPIWAQGYVRCVIDNINPRSKYAKENKEWWERVKAWAKLPLLT